MPAEPKCRILIVDDDEESLGVLSEWFRGHHDFDTAISADQAVHSVSGILERSMPAHT